MTTCPKCLHTSGDDWSQCRGECPMPGSPHNRGDTFEAFQARVTAAARVITEADLYWRADRWSVA